MPSNQGGRDRGWYFWVFATPFMFAPDIGQVPLDSTLRQGFVLFYDVSNDGLTYILHIDPDAVFTDGTPLTAQEVKKYWEFNVLPENQHIAGRFLAQLRSIEGMEAIENGESGTAAGLVALDDHTLEVSHTRVDRLWALKLAGWRFGAYKVDYALENPDTWLRNPVGAGPYTVHVDQTAQAAELRTSENYWKDPAVNDGMTIPSVQDLQTNFLMYENQEADIMFADDARQPAMHDPDHRLFNQLQEIGNMSLWITGFVVDHPPFDELPVRKAFAHGADMQAIATAVVGPLAEAAGGILTTGSPCNQQPAGLYQYDPELARQSLAESSYITGSNLPKITIEISRPQIIRMFEIMQQQWKDNLDVNINLIRLERGQTRQDVVEFRRTSGGSDIPGPDVMIFRFGHSTGSSARTASFFVNPELDTAIEQAMALPLDIPNRCDIFLDIERAIVGNYYWLPLSKFSSHVYAVRPWVQGWHNSWGRLMVTLPHIRVGERNMSLYE